MEEGSAVEADGRTPAGGGNNCLQRAAGEGHKERHEIGVYSCDWHGIVRISGGPQEALWLSKWADQVFAEWSDGW